MIDIKKIRDGWQGVATNLERRGVEKDAVEDLWKADKKWLKLSQQVEELRSEQNKANEFVAVADKDEKAKLIKDLKKISAEIKEKEEKFNKIIAKRDKLWRALPNIIFDDVPNGGEDDAELISESKVKVPAFDFETRSYLELLPGSVDIERAAKVSGSRFVYLKNKLARLELGLVSFAFDQLTEAGFETVIPPVLIKKEAMAGMGYLDHDGDEIYKTQDDLYLVGTSEQAIGPMHMNETLDASSPIRYVAYSSCFRREAGSHGKDVKGMLRVHQFNKVEMFSFCSSTDSEKEHEFLLEQQQSIMDTLALPYRVIKLAAGDLGSPSAKTYDIETWMPGEDKFRETHSTSNTTDYQARRLNVRVKGGEKAHMLNGTAIAVGRILIALIENNQQSDGSILIPEALKPYLPFEKIEA
jgi:seryl-tRNA synthetase